MSRRYFVMAAGAVALAGGGHVAGAFREARASSRLRVAQRSQVVPTRSGALEYAVAGRGAPVLLLHGAGGGFDQGLRFGQGLIARGFQVVAPSRFGYLGSDFPPDASPAAQADALADLLDWLGIERLPVIGGSAGALPAAEFALRHPGRCSRLVLLVPAMNLSGRDPVEFTPLQRFLADRLLSSDFWFWSAARLAPGQLIGMFLATDPALLDRVGLAERERARLILEELMPISRRVRGLRNDAHYAGSPADIDLARISAPTLVVSAEDDRFGTAKTARTIARRMADARLVIYPDGGHIWLGRDDELAAEIARFIGGERAER